MKWRLTKEVREARHNGIVVRIIYVLGKNANKYSIEIKTPDDHASRSLGAYGTLQAAMAAGEDLLRGE